MLKNLMNNVKEMTAGTTEAARKKADDLAIEAAKSALIKSAAENKIAIHELLTPKIEEKFDELAQTILEEHGYKKLMKMGLITKFTS